MPTPVTDPKLLSLLEGSAAAQGPAPVSDDMQKLLDMNVKADAENQRQQAEFTRLRQQSAVNEANAGSKKLARAVIPTLGAAAGFIPGVGTLAQMGIGAGTEAASQALGDQPYDLKQIALAGAIPAAAHGVTSAIKGAARGIADFLNPSVAKEAGVEAAVQKSGNAVPFKSAGRQAITAGEAAAPSDLAYNAARASQTPIGANNINKALNSAYSELVDMGAPQQALTQVERISNRFAGKPNISPNDLIDELQNLKRTAKDTFKAGNSVAGTRLQGLVDTVAQDANAIPELAKANKLYQKERATEEIISKMRGGNPPRMVADLLENDPKVASAFTPAERKDIQEITDMIGRIGSGKPFGTLDKITQIGREAFGQALATKGGRYLIRQTFKNGVTPEGMAVLGQFMRAYNAQGGE